MHDTRDKKLGSSTRAVEFPHLTEFLYPEDPNANHGSAAGGIIPPKLPIKEVSEAELAELRETNAATERSAQKLFKLG